MLKVRVIRQFLILISFLMFYINLKHLKVNLSLNVFFNSLEEINENKTNLAFYQHNYL